MGGGGLTPGPGAVPPGALADVTLADVAAAFGERLRRSGLAVTPEREARFVQAILLARPLRLDELGPLARVTLLSDRRDLAVFEQVFQAVFRGLVDPAESRGDSAQRKPRAPASRTLGPAAAKVGGERSPSDVASAADEGDAGALPLGLLGAGERLAHKDFASCTESELAQLTGLMAKLAVSLPLRRSRRLRHSRHGGELDLRATLRRAHRAAGDPVALIRRRKLRRPRRLVMLADVSGSMEPYTRVYLHLFHGAVRAAGAEAFVFATRLTRLTAVLATGDPDLALRRAGEAANDWAGGTLIGRALEEFNDVYGRRGMARGAVLVIVSDGWEGGDPALLAQQLERLARLAHCVIWVNPRSARAGFQPLTRGMTAAMPHLDKMVSGHSLAAIDLLLDAIHGDGR